MNKLQLNLKTAFIFAFVIALIHYGAHMIIPSITTLGALQILYVGSIVTLSVFAGTMIILAKR